ncbi:MAG: Do family serine endopeptidase [Acidobacteria bacterium]|nr:MAG: Do family serine endopeptidase [Acidobacteriota bacterium]
MSWFGSSSRKTTIFYVVLIAMASLVVGMVIASRLDLSPASSAQSMAIPATNSAPLTGPVDAATFRTIAKAQSPMVVSIRTESRQRTQDLSEFFGGDDLFERFFGGPNMGAPNQNPRGQQQPPRRQQPRDRTTQAAGSGFIISKDGFILTNNHVVEGASKIEVQFFHDDDEEYYEAKVVGRDPLTDSALIQLVEKPSGDLTVARFGDSSQMEPGDWVMAIGNPFGLAHTVSVGVVSATGRNAFDFTPGRRQPLIQTDAAINPGNSGGPLLNVRGEVIGINTAIYSGGSALGTSGNIGIGFAVPINTVRDVLPGLRAGKITRGRIGVSVRPVSPDEVEALSLKDRRGAVVAQVPPGPAATAGIEPGDVIVEFNSKPIARSDDLPGLVAATSPGTTVPVKVIREGKERTFSVRVEELNLDTETARQADADTPGGDTGAGFGITLNNVTPEIARQFELPTNVRGAVVTEIDPDSPAARVLQPGDVILEVSRKPVANANEASAALRTVPSGRAVGMLINRRGDEQFVTVRKQ